MSEDMANTLIISLTSVVVVFTVLIALSYCFSAMKFFAVKEKDVAKENQPILADNIEASTIEPEVTDDRELVAVISAALASFMGNNVIVSSIRRVEDTTVWSKVDRH